MPAVPRKVYVIDGAGHGIGTLPPLLRSFGWPVRVFSSAPECLYAVLKETPDCIVSDVDMPGTTSEQFAAVLATRKIDVPIVMVTQEAEGSPLIARARMAGVRAILQQPYQDSDLFRSIQQAIRRTPGPQTW